MDINQNSMFEVLDDLISQNIFCQKKIVLFGANKSSKQMKEYLEKFNISVSAVIDNDKRKAGQSPFGVMTYSPEELLLPFNEKFVILIVSQYYAEMTAQLEKMGYELDKNIFIVQKLLRKYDTSMDVFNYFKKSINKGMEIYSNIVEQYNITVNDSWRFFICPYGGNGDIYIIGQFLDEYIKQNNISDYVITVVGKACKKVGEMFNWKNIVVLNVEESDALVQFSRTIGLKEAKVDILNDCFIQTVNRRLRAYKNLDFRRIFQREVFNQSITDKVKLKEKLQNDTDIIRYAEEKGIIKGKTVILSPYANTVSIIPSEIWEKIAEYFIEKGYKVFTNSSSPEEPVIDGTEPICAPFAYMRQVIEYAGVFIAVRSGLCDIIAAADAVKVILYPKGRLFGACSTYDYFSLNKMGLCDDAVEVEYGDENLEFYMDIIKKL